MEGTPTINEGPYNSIACNILNLKLIVIMIIQFFVMSSKYNSYRTENNNQA